MSGFNTSQSTAEPWKEQIPYLEKGFTRADEVYGPQGSFMKTPYFPDKTLAGFDPYQTMGQESIVNYATGRRPAAMQSHAENALLRQLGGRVPMGAGTPWNAMANVYRQQAEDQMMQGLANVRQGMVGSANMPVQPGGGSRGDLAQERIVGQGQKAIAQNLASMYGNAYGQAQQDVSRGMQAYPSIMGAPLSMYGAIADVGADRRAMTQEDINQGMARYDYNVTRPQTALQNYMASISGNYGGTTRATPSPLSTIGQLGSLALGIQGLGIG